MSASRQVRLPAALLTAALIAAISLSGVARNDAPPISTAIPSPFADPVPIEVAVPLGIVAPRWAERLYSRSLLVLRSLTDPVSGAQIAGASDGWDYVWPRDAAAGALALAAAGQPEVAKRVVDFLEGLDLDSAARFEADGGPVPGRPAAGDAQGWVAAAAEAIGEPGRAVGDWVGRQDYGENLEGDLLGNAIASGAPAREIVDRFATDRGLAREPGGGTLDSAAAWAVVPFERSGLERPARRTLLSLVADSSRFGIGPTEEWTEGEAWTAPTAWSAWALARLGERGAADMLLAALRRAATDEWTLPERVSITDGRPLSTTPLAWSHAFAALALLERYPPR